MPKTNIRHVINEAFKNALSQPTNEAFGMFGRRREEPTGMSPSDWDMKSRHHRNMTIRHTELAHDFDRMGNREAGDYHTRAADAHSQAAKALHFNKDDAEGYDQAAQKAQNASREADVFIKEDRNRDSDIIAESDENEHPRAKEFQQRLSAGYGTSTYTNPQNIRTEVTRGENGSYYAGVRKYRTLSDALHALDRPSKSR